MKELDHPPGHEAAWWLSVLVLLPAADVVLVFVLDAVLLGGLAAIALNIAVLLGWGRRAGATIGRVVGGVLMSLATAAFGLFVFVVTAVAPRVA